MSWTDVPMIIPSFNNPTHLHDMVAQLQSLGLHDIRIVDSASSFPPMLDLLSELERKDNGIRVMRLHENRGPRFILAGRELARLPQFFCLTDPDLRFNTELPKDFLSQLAGLTEKHRIGKAGFALDISEPEKLWPNYFFIAEKPHKIWEWEAQFWLHQIDTIEDNPVYSAPIDTTFALYNKLYFQCQNFYRALRIGGNYTAKHLPWFRSHRLPPDEVEYYNAHAHRSAYQMKSLSMAYDQLRKQRLLHKWQSIYFK